MVDFSRSDRETDLETRTHEFIRAVIIPAERDPRQTIHGPTSELVHELRVQARKARLLAPQVAERWGGYGLSHRETATVLRASGYSLLGPVAMNCMAPDEGNMHLLDAVATEAQKKAYLAPLAAGEIRSAFLMTEPDGGAGSDPEMLTTTARAVGSDWIIDGRKWLITGAIGARFGIVMARTPQGATMFLTQMDAPGITIERVLDTLDQAIPGGHSVIRLAGLRVPASQVLGTVGAGFRYAQVRLAPARLTHCMRWWGAARRAHDIAVEYACQRRAFGKPLIEHEGVGFMLARNQVDLLQTQLLIDYTAWTLDQGSRANTESSMAKMSCAETLFQIVDRCVQVLGGLGITTDTQVARIFHAIRAFRIYDGPTEVHLWSLARRLQRQGSQAHGPLQP
ncbi:MAG: acyl-CoA dehydrogenase family protein [Pseudomonadales bacterium]|nr:acyl-CoA dehydrogenase family protein [Pseudomonadales bacterium]